MLKRLSSIFVFSFVVLSSIFLITVSIISYRVFFSFTSDEISEARLTLVNEGLRQVSNYMTQVSDAGLYIIINRGLIDIFSNPELDVYQSITEQREITRFINDVQSFRKEIHSIEIYTDRYDDFRIIRNSPIYPLHLIENESWFQDLKTADNGWIPKHRSPSTKEYVVSYFHHILDSSRRVKGYLKINILPNSFFDSITDVDLMADSHDQSLILFDANGRVMDEITTISDRNSPLRELLIYEKEKGNFYLQEPYRNLNNNYERFGKEQKYLFLMSKSVHALWRLGHVINIDVLYRDIKRIGWLVSFVGILSLVLLVPLAYYVTKRLLKPLNYLIAAMQKVEKGNLQVKVDPGNIEEYQILGHNFNRMTDQLDRLLKEVQIKSRQKREVEIESLQSHIVPHFLYNTLDLIHWKALNYGAEDISHMVNQLSRLYRIGVSNGKPFILLRDELKHAECYINLQSIRLGKKIHYHVHVPAALKHVYVPKIILQPLIENSMKHGYPYHLDEDNGIRIKIRIETTDEKLKINVIDYGIGFPQNWTLEETSGIGIKNIENRLTLYFGHEASIKIIDQEKGGNVQMTFPLIKDLRMLDHI